MRNIINLILVFVIISALALIAFLVNDRNSNEKTTQDEIENIEDDEVVEENESHESENLQEDDSEEEEQLDNNSRISLESPTDNYKTTRFLPITGSISDYLRGEGVYFVITDSKDEKVLEKFHFFDRKADPSDPKETYFYEFSEILDLREALTNSGSYTLVIRTYDQHSKGVEFEDEYEVNFKYVKN